MLLYGTVLPMYLKVLVFLFAFGVRVQSEECVTPNKEQGQCIYLYMCHVLFETAQTNQDPSVDEFIQKSICGGTRYAPKVCCSSSNVTVNAKSNVKPEHELPVAKKSLLAGKKYCGYQHSDDYERPENDTSIRINEFPWLAHLIYKQKDTGEEDFKCSGSLINTRYILTAAHCLLPPTEYLLIGVRLGEYYFSNQSDCVQEPPYDQECSDVQDFGIEKKIPHPDYLSASYQINDIGLIRLNRSVQYSDYIRPICLPLPGTIFASAGDVMTTSGWGLTKPDVRAQLKKKILNKLVTNEECTNSYRVTNKIIVNITENHMCLRQINSDTICRFDNGGPVMFSNNFQWHQEGVISFGTSVCGPSQIPDVSTKVVNYMQWIEENLET